MTAALTAAQARRRFLWLLGLRWLPVGLMIPVTVLLPLDRGLTLAQYGSAAALQGLAVLLLELPTGGLSDALGRRPVLLLAGVVDVAALSLLTVADSVLIFVIFYLLRGVHRALDSGPLEAWYVDHALAADEHADIEAGLSRSGVVLGVAIAVGALTTGGLVAFGPLDRGAALGLPVHVALGLQVVSLIAVTLLMTEQRPRRGVAALIGSVRGVPAAIGGALSLVRRSRIITALVAVELFWGFGMVAFESLMPVRLAEVVGDPGQASALMGPVGSVAWLASALGAALIPLLARRIGAPWTGFVLRIVQGGAALIPLLARRIGAPWTGFVLRIVQGGTVAGMALFAGPAGVIAAYLLCYTVHGAANPVHNGLLHRQVDGPYRASLLSLNSMVSQPAGALGLVTLTTVATATSLRVALLVGAVVLAVAAPLYLIARGVPGAPRPGPLRHLEAMEKSR